MSESQTGDVGAGNSRSADKYGRSTRKDLADQTDQERSGSTGDVNAPAQLNQQTMRASSCDNSSSTAGCEGAEPKIDDAGWRGGRHAAARAVCSNLEDAKLSRGATGGEGKRLDAWSTQSRD